MSNTGAGQSRDSPAQTGDGPRIQTGALVCGMRASPLPWGRREPSEVAGGGSVALRTRATFTAT